jgi:CRP/FNR family transcriptional regulator, anaerobic regulatory protein
MHELIQHIRSRVAVCDSEMALITSQFTPRVLKRNEHVFRSGQVAPCSAYVIRGCFRYYKLNNNHDEFTTQFAFEDWWIGDLQSLFASEPAGLSLQALEESLVLTVDKKGYDCLFGKSPAFHELFRMNRNKGFHKLNQLMMDRMSKTAEERYMDLVQQHPQVLQRVSLKHIASYLGIKAQSLSRIRKNIAQLQIT